MLDRLPTGAYLVWEVAEGQHRQGADWHTVEASAVTWAGTWFEFKSSAGQFLRLPEEPALPVASPQGRGLRRNHSGTPVEETVAPPAPGVVRVTPSFVGGPHAAHAKKFRRHNVVWVLDEPLPWRMERVSARCADDTAGCFVSHTMCARPDGRVLIRDGYTWYTMEFAIAVLLHFLLDPVNTDLQVWLAERWTSLSRCAQSCCAQSFREAPLSLPWSAAPEQPFACALRTGGASHRLAISRLSSGQRAAN